MYFVRFINNPAHAQSDLERGYSFYGHQFYATVEAAEDSDMIEYHGFTADDIAPMDRDGVEVYGFALDGLSGFGGFDAVEEAETAARAGFLMYSHAAIYTGTYRDADPDSLGVLFRPRELVRVLEVR